MTRKTIWTNSDGLKVGFGPQSADYTNIGEVNKDGHNREFRFVLDGEKFSSGTYQFENTVTIPAGAIPQYAHVQVTEVFALGGTSPVISIGDSGDANRFGDITEANAEALGTYTLTVAATPTTSALSLAVVLGGTSPTVTSAGKAEVVIGYRVV